jgi:hypothetical protein
MLRRIFGLEVLRTPVWAWLVSLVILAFVIWLAVFVGFPDNCPRLPDWQGCTK